MQFVRFNALTDTVMTVLQQITVCNVFIYTMVLIIVILKYTDIVIL